jgi:HlyD family secretion protein
MRWLLPLGIVGVAAIGLVWWRKRPAAASHITAPVTRGPIIRTVIATGSVNPVVTVQVGAFVSGTIRTLYCDYNTKVKANQLCAKIDPRPYQVVVDQNAAALGSARAQLVKDQASLTYARLNDDRDLGLQKRGVVSQDNVDIDKSTLDQAVGQVALDRATVTQHEAELRAAQVNLQYTNIVSPVEGTVISRNIDVGQTVASSFQTPMLFLVATDLTRMQVDASVSESDIGAVAVGQPASFTVEAYPNRTFWGHVAQIRRAPITVQNVVTYDVVVAVSNPDQLLLPGMTANSRIVTAQRDSVLRIPLQALRYAPHGVGPAAGTRSGASQQKKVWVVRNGQAVAVPVMTGVDDGTLTEVVSRSLSAGDRVIIGESEAAGGSSGSRGGGAGKTPQPAMRF